MGLLDNKVCVITGGAGSVGLASARLFLDEGAKVMLVDLDDAAIARAVTGLASPHVDGVAADVTQAAATRHYVERAVTRFGAIDVLFSNAGNQGVVAPVTRCNWHGIIVVGGPGKDLRWEPTFGRQTRARSRTRFHPDEAGDFLVADLIGGCTEPGPIDP